MRIRPLLLGLALLALSMIGFFGRQASPPMVLVQGGSSEGNLVLSLALASGGVALMMFAFWRRRPTRLPASVYEEDPNPDYMASTHMAAAARRPRRS